MIRVIEQPLVPGLNEFSVTGRLGPIKVCPAGNLVTVCDTSAARREKFRVFVVVGPGALPDWASRGGYIGSWARPKGSSFHAVADIRED